MQTKKNRGRFHWIQSTNAPEWERKRVSAQFSEVGEKSEKRKAGVRPELVEKKYDKCNNSRMRSFRSYKIMCVTACTFRSQWWFFFLCAFLFFCGRKFGKLPPGANRVASIPVVAGAVYYMHSTLHHQRGKSRQVEWEPKISAAEKNGQRKKGRWRKNGKTLSAGRMIVLVECAARFPLSVKRNKGLFYESTRCEFFFRFHCVL